MTEASVKELCFCTAFKRKAARVPLRSAPDRRAESPSLCSIRKPWSCLPAPLSTMIREALPASGSPNTVMILLAAAFSPLITRGKYGVAAGIYSGLRFILSHEKSWPADGGRCGGGGDFLPVKAWRKCWRRAYVVDISVVFKIKNKIKTCVGKE